MYPDEGVSCIEEPPETPAYVFALRAFKSAIFGTPQLEQKNVRTKPQASVETDYQEQDGHSSRVQDEKRTSQGGAPDSKVTATNLTEPMVSPAKGILLTPGVGTSRRKNVSFMNVAIQDQVQDEAAATVENVLSQDDSPSERSHRRVKRPRPSSLTKTLIELSNQRASKHLEVQSPGSEVKDFSAAQRAIDTQDDAIQTELDQTVDLSQPRSRSGQHWKTEFEHYFQKSDHEMKEIIKYGQNVKSFAVKKDSEAAMLAQKLQEELARIEAIEAKAAKMAKRLSIAESEDTKGAGDHARLVSELAQQTALALRFKQKADHYRKANQQRSSDAKACDITEESQILADRGQDSQDAAQSEPRKKIESLNQIAREAEERARNIQAENATLKRSLARLKTEMMSYDTRRQAREDRLKKREETHKKAREVAEAQLQKLKIDYLKLQQEKQLGPTACHSHGSNMQRPLDSVSLANRPEPIKDPEVQLSSLKENRTISRSRSPRKRRQQKPPIDIWTLSSPHESEGQSKQPQPTESTELPPSSVGKDIKKALREIDVNLVSERPPRTAGAAAEHINTKEPIGFEEGAPVFPSTSLALTSDQILRSTTSKSNTAASSPTKLQLTSSQLNPSPLSRTARSTIGRSGSMLSDAVGRRTSTMGSSRRGTAMTAERAAAARERLARRSAEKKKMLRG